jgi:hypothetical protein
MHAGLYATDGAPGRLVAAVEWRLRWAGVQPLRRALWIVLVQHTRSVACRRNLRPPVQIRCDVAACDAMRLRRNVLHEVKGGRHHKVEERFLHAEAAEATQSTFIHGAGFI